MGGERVLHLGREADRNEPLRRIQVVLPAFVDDPSIAGSAGSGVVNHTVYLVSLERCLVVGEQLRAKAAQTSDIPGTLSTSAAASASVAAGRRRLTAPAGRAPRLPAPRVTVTLCGAWHEGEP